MEMENGCIWKVPTVDGSESCTRWYVISLYR